jgi:cytidine deaminase
VTTPAQEKRLIVAAQRARMRAYAPYSQFCVGAAILTEGGRVFTGCNVENATYGATLCAERSAVAAMVTAGERAPVACAVVTGASKPTAPCGICRQVLFEFAPNLVVILASVDERGRVTPSRIHTMRLKALLPRAFSLAPGGGGRPQTSGRSPR